MPLLMHVALDEEMPMEYCQFFIMLANDLLDLTRPCFHDDKEIDDIYWRIVETVCIHEGMFPLYESLFQWHQLIDLARHIKNLSITKNFTCLSSERALHGIKEHVHFGGRSMDKTVTRRYVANETEKTKLAYGNNDDIINYSKKQNSDNYNMYIEENTVYYDNFAYKLITKFKTNNKKNNLFNAFEMDAIFKTLILEIKKKTNGINEALRLSPTFRLYATYKFYLQSNNKSSNQCTFFEYISNISSYIFLGDNELCNKNKIINYLDPENIISNGTIFEDDVGFANQLLNLRRYTNRIYTSAIVCGNEINGRGINFRETAPGMIIPDDYGSETGAYIPNNSFNILRQNWNRDMKTLSSWCRLHRSKYKLSNWNNEAFNVNSKFKFHTVKLYAQANFF
jgi:hypothetical protein